MSKQIHVVAKAELPQDRTLYIQLEEKAILLYQHNQRYQAIDAICTHQKIPLTEDCILDNSIICPLHGAKFELPTGKCLRRPAVNDLQTYRVTETEEAIYIELD